MLAAGNGKRTLAPGCARSISAGGHEHRGAKPLQALSPPTNLIKAHLGRIIAAQEAAHLHEVSSWGGLQRWCDHFVTATRATNGAGGCPLGSLVGQVADQSEPARRVLAQCFAEWQSYLADGFEAMRDNGELAAQADPAELALTLMSALQGGLLMAQATRSARPLELALTMALQHMAAYRRRPKQAGRR